MSLVQKVKEFFTPNRRAFTAILVGSVISILIGSVLLVITYLVLSSLITAATPGLTPNSTMNASFYRNITVITQALTIVGVSLIVAGVAGLIYMLMGFASVGMAGPRGR